MSECARDCKLPFRWRDGVSFQKRGELMPTTLGQSVLWKVACILSFCRCIAFALHRAGTEPRRGHQRRDSCEGWQHWQVGRWLGNLSENPELAFRVAFRVAFRLCRTSTDGKLGILAAWISELAQLGMNSRAEIAHLQQEYSSPASPTFSPRFAALMWMESDTSRVSSKIPDAGFLGFQKVIRTRPGWLASSTVKDTAGQEPQECA